MTKLNGRVIDLVQLQAELTADGIGVPALGTAGDDLHTYDAHGVVIDLPAGATAVLAAHEPAPPPPDKNEILLSLLDGLTPGDEATEVILLVQQEMLRP